DTDAAGGSTRVESCARAGRTRAVTHATSAKAGTAPALRAEPMVRRALVSGCEAITSQLGFAALREALHEVVERLPRIGHASRPLLAESELVQRRRSAIPLRPARADARVLDERAVELRLREEALSRSILGVIGQVGVRVAAQVLAVAAERERVTAL